MTFKLKIPTIQNAEVIKQILTDTYINPLKEKVPNQLASKIVPVLSVNPFRVANIVRYGNASGTIYTTPTDTDFFLTGFNMSALTGSCILSIIIDGATVTLARIEAGAGLITATANNFPFPIKLDRGSNIVMGAALGGNITIIGYTVNRN